MAELHPSLKRNRLLAALSPADLDLLQPALEPCLMPLKTVLVQHQEPIEHAYFLEDGLASMVAIGSADDWRIEVAVIGSEGMTGTPILYGVDRSPHLTFMQVAGKGARIRVQHLAAAMDASTSLRGVLLRYAHTLTVGIADTALANGRNSISERLARWLLTCQDRLGRDDLPLTHEFLGLMLGVRRSGVTVALHVLEGEHVISSTRGRVVVLDRPRLLEIAGDCYGGFEAEYDRVMNLRAKPNGVGYRATLSPVAA